MLEVHAPHEKIHGFRDFLLHLVTITVGLLIALGLEGLVQWSHHRELRHEADAKLHQEIRDNQKELGTVRGAITKERENLISSLKYLQARGAGQHYDIRDISLSFSWGTLHDASWRTAAATGALGYMAYPHVQRYAAAYQLQESFSVLQAQTLDEFLQLQSYVIFGFDPEKMAPSAAQTASVDVRRALSHLIAMDQIGGALAETYSKALASE